MAGLDIKRLDWLERRTVLTNHHSVEDIFNIAWFCLGPAEVSRTEIRVGEVDGLEDQTVEDMRGLERDETGSESIRVDQTGPSARALLSLPSERTLYTENASLHREQHQCDRTSINFGTLVYN
jgi:hypothetical protein